MNKVDKVVEIKTIKIIILRFFLNLEITRKDNNDNDACRLGNKLTGLSIL